MKGLKEQIQKGTLGNLYLFYGVERFLVQLYEQRMRKALLAPEEEMMNLDVMESPADADMIKSSAETLPFMAEKRLVIVKNSGAFEAKAGRFAALADWIANLPETTVLLWIETKVDQRGKLFKAVKKHGYVMEFTRQGERELAVWVRQEMRRQKIQIEGREIAYFLSLIGNDMVKIQEEMDKLSSYVKETGVVTKADIDAIVTPALENSIFKLTDCLGNQQPARAYRLYQELLASDQDEKYIFYMLIRQFRLLHKACLLQGSQPTVIAKELGIPTFAVSNYVSQSRRFGLERLRKLLTTLLDMDVSTKTGLMDAKEACSLLILQYANLQNG